MFALVFFLKINQRELAENLFDEMVILFQDNTVEKIKRKFVEVKKLLEE